MDVTSSLDPRILGIVRGYTVAKVPRVCPACDGAGSVRRNVPYYEWQIFVASSWTEHCERCDGRGVTWVDP